MSDTNGPTVSVPTVRPQEPPHNRLVRMLHWFRGIQESRQVREHYANIGVLSSRIYAVTLPMFVLIFAQFDIPPGIDYAIMAAWALATRPYLWYQGQAALAYDVVEESHANRDLINSFLPMISIALMVALWILMIGLYYAGISTKTIGYGWLGWYILAIGSYDVAFDLSINNRFTLRLGKIPGRVEMHESPPPRA